MSNRSWSIPAPLDGRPDLREDQFSTRIDGTANAKIQFSLVVEPDDNRWFACISEFEHLGVATWGKTREEAAKNLLEVAIMTFQDLGKDASELLT